MKLSTQTTGRVVGGTAVMLAVAAMATPAATASGALDPWQQNLNARAKYAQVSDPWALHLFARQTHRDGENTTAGLLRPFSIVSTGGGFDWADFGFGAASMLGALVAVGATALAIQRTRRHTPAA